jgi:hypothetical protein
MGPKSVKIFGQKVDVAASVHTLGGLSGHAGQKDPAELDRHPRTVKAEDTS